MEHHVLPSLPDAISPNVESNVESHSTQSPKADIIAAHRHPHRSLRTSITFSPLRLGAAAGVLSSRYNRYARSSDDDDDAEMGDCESDKAVYQGTVRHSDISSALTPLSSFTLASQTPLSSSNPETKLFLGASPFSPSSPTRDPQVRRMALSSQSSSQYGLVGNPGLPRSQEEDAIPMTSNNIDTSGDCSHNDNRENGSNHENKTGAVVCNDDEVHSIPNSCDGNGNSSTCGDSLLISSDGTTSANRRSSSTSSPDAPDASSLTTSNSDGPSRSFSQTVLHMLEHPNQPNRPNDQTGLSSTRPSLPSGVTPLLTTTTSPSLDARRSSHRQQSFSQPRKSQQPIPPDPNAFTPHEGDMSDNDNVWSGLTRPNPLVGGKIPNGEASPALPPISAPSPRLFPRTSVLTRRSASPSPSTTPSPALSAAPSPRIPPGLRSPHTPLRGPQHTPSQTPRLPRQHSGSVSSSVSRTLSSSSPSVKGKSFSFPSSSSGPSSRPPTSSTSSKTTPSRSARLSTTQPSASSTTPVLAPEPAFGFPPLPIPPHGLSTTARHSGSLPTPKTSPKSTDEGSSSSSSATPTFNPSNPTTSSISTSTPNPIPAIQSVTPSPAVTRGRLHRRNGSDLPRDPTINNLSSTNPHNGSKTSSTETPPSELNDNEANNGVTTDNVSLSSHAGVESGKDTTTSTPLTDDNTIGGYDTGDMQRGHIRGTGSGGSLIDMLGRRSILEAMPEETENTTVQTSQSLGSSHITPIEHKTDDANQHDTIDRQSTDVPPHQSIQYAPPSEETRRLLNEIDTLRHHLLGAERQLDVEREARRLDRQRAYMKGLDTESATTHLAGTTYPPGVSPTSSSSMTNRPFVPLRTVTPILNRPTTPLVPSTPLSSSSSSSSSLTASTPIPLSRSGSATPLARYPTIHHYVSTGTLPSSSTNPSTSVAVASLPQAPTLLTIPSYPSSSPVQILPSPLSSLPVPVLRSISTTDQQELERFISKLQERDSEYRNGFDTLQKDRDILSVMLHEKAAENATIISSLAERIRVAQEKYEKDRKAKLTSTTSANSSDTASTPVDNSQSIETESKSIGHARTSSQHDRFQELLEEIEKMRSRGSINDRGIVEREKDVAMKQMELKRTEEVLQAREEMLRAREEAMKAKEEDDMKTITNLETALAAATAATASAIAKSAMDKYQADEKVAAQLKALKEENDKKVDQLVREKEDAMMERMMSMVRESEATAKRKEEEEFARVEDLQLSLKDWKDKYDQAQKELAGLKVTNEDTGNVLKTKEAELQSAKEGILALEATLEAWKTENVKTVQLNTSKVDELLNQQSALREELATAREMISRLDAEKTQAEQHQQTGADETSRIRSQLLNTVNEVNALKMQLSEKDHQLNEVKTKMDEALKKTEDSKARSASVLDSASQSKQRADAAEARVLTLESELRDVKHSQEESENEIHRLSTQLDSALKQASELEAKVMASKREQEAADSEARRLKEELSQLVEKCDGQTSQLQQLETTNKELSGRMNTLCQERDELRKHQQDLEIQLEASKCLVEEAKEQVKLLKLNADATLQNVVTKLEGEKKELEESQQALEVKLKSLDQQKRKLEKQVEEYAGKLRDAVQLNVDAIAMLEEKVQEQSDAIAVQGAANDAAEARVRELEAKLAKQEDITLEKEREAARRTDEVEALKREKEKVERTLREIVLESGDKTVELESLKKDLEEKAALVVRQADELKIVTQVAEETNRSVNDLRSECESTKHALNEALKRVTVAEKAAKKAETDVLNAAQLEAQALSRALAAERIAKDASDKADAAEERAVKAESLAKEREELLNVTVEREKKYKEIIQEKLRDTEIKAAEKISELQDLVKKAEEKVNDSEIALRNAEKQHEQQQLQLQEQYEVKTRELLLEADTKVTKLRQEIDERAAEEAKRLNDKLAEQEAVHNREKENLQAELRESKEIVKELSRAMSTTLERESRAAATPTSTSSQYSTSKPYGSEHSMPSSPMHTTTTTEITPLSTHNSNTQHSATSPNTFLSSRRGLPPPLSTTPTQTPSAAGASVKDLWDRTSIGSHDSTSSKGLANEGVRDSEAKATDPISLLSMDPTGRRSQQHDVETPTTFPSDRLSMSPATARFVSSPIQAFNSTVPVSSSVLVPVARRNPFLIAVPTENSSDPLTSFSQLNHPQQSDDLDMSPLSTSSGLSSPFLGAATALALDPSVSSFEGDTTLARRSAGLAQLNVSTTATNSPAATPSTRGTSRSSTLSTNRREANSTTTRDRASVTTPTGRPHTPLASDLGHPSFLSSSPTPFTGSAGTYTSGRDSTVPQLFLSLVASETSSGILCIDDDITLKEGAGRFPRGLSDGVGGGSSYSYPATSPMHWRGSGANTPVGSSSSLSSFGSTSSLTSSPFGPSSSSTSMSNTSHWKEWREPDLSLTAQESTTMKNEAQGMLAQFRRDDIGVELGAIPALIPSTLLSEALIHESVTGNVTITRSDGALCGALLTSVKVCCTSTHHTIIMLTLLNTNLSVPS